MFVTGFWLLISYLLVFLAVTMETTSPAMQILCALPPLAFVVLGAANILRQRATVMRSGPTTFGVATNVETATQVAVGGEQAIVTGSLRVLVGGLIPLGILLFGIAEAEVPGKVRQLAALNRRLE